jgi:catechol 2,3-dioxygenase-like lactoylglutathione lyase family enzyme
MLIDCELMGRERRIELHVPDVPKAWRFYRDIMGAQEVFRSESGMGGATRIGFTIGKAGFAITSRDHAGSNNGRSTLSQLAADFGAQFAAVVVYVRNPATAAQHALDAGSRLQPEAASGTPTHRGQPVKVIIDPFGNSWAFANTASWHRRRRQT